MRRRLPLLVLLAVLLGCGDDDDPSDGGARRDAGAIDAGAIDAGEARLEIGEGPTSFRPLIEGDAMELTAGSQGGFHLDIATRFYAVDPEGLLLSIRGVSPETGERLAIPVDRVLTEARVSWEGDHWLRVGDRLILETFDPAEVVGREIRVEVAATPVGGAEVSESRVVRIVDER